MTTFPIPQHLLLSCTIFCFTTWSYGDSFHILSVFFLVRQALVPHVLSTSLYADEFCQGFERVLDLLRAKVRDPYRLLVVVVLDTMGRGSCVVRGTICRFSVICFDWMSCLFPSAQEIPSSWHLGIRRILVGWGFATCIMCSLP